MAVELPPALQAIARVVFPISALLLAFTLFSLYTVLVKKAISDGTSPLVLALLREIIATAVLLPKAYALERMKPGSQRKFKVDAEDHGTFFFLGFAMIYGVQLLSALALEHLSANTYALLAPSVPVFCLILAMITKMEPFDRHNRASWMKVGSIVVSVAGALIIAVSAYVNHPSANKGSVLIGLGLLLGNKICVATYPLIEKRLMNKYSTATVVGWGYAYGALLTAISVLPCATGASTTWTIGASGWGAILFSSLISSAFNYSLMAYVNKHTSPVLVMSFYPWQSIATPLLAWGMLGTPLAGEDAVGGVVIVLGLMLLTYARWKEGKNTSAAAAASAGAGGKADNGSAASTDVVIAAAALEGPGGFIAGAARLADDGDDHGDRGGKTGMAAASEWDAAAAALELQQRPPTLVDAKLPAASATAVTIAGHSAALGGVEQASSAMPAAFTGTAGGDADADLDQHAQVWR